MRLSVPRTPVSRLVAVFLLASWGASAAEADPLAKRFDPRVAKTLFIALSQAEQKLRRPGCALIFADFTDGRTGRPLSETLSSSCDAPVEHLRSLHLLNGTASERCKRSEAAAYTSAGAPVVFICPAAFVRIHETWPGLPSTVLIHELLHTLGLGENPPTSRQITRQVQVRCGP